MLDKQEIKRRDWIKTLHPRDVVWEVTLECNQRCLHCASSAMPLKKRLDELNTKEALNAICDFKELGIERVCFSGGEPFLRKDWEILADMVAGLGMRPGFISNGFLLDNKTVKKISRLGKLGVCVSLSIDGNEQVHDYIRQVKGSFKRVTGALSLLSQYNIPVSVITQVSKMNFGVLAELRDHIFKYGTFCWQLQLAVPMGRMAENKKSLFSPEDYCQLADFLRQQRRLLKDKLRVPDNIGYYTEAEKDFRPDLPWKGCQAGLMILGLTSNGGVTGCLSLQGERFIEGNIRDRSLKDIWFDPNLFSYNRRFKEENLRGYCKRCDYRLDCRGGCNSTAYGFSGELGENFYCLHRIKQNQAVPPEEFKLPLPYSTGNYHP